MAGFSQNVNTFTAPPDWQAEAQDIDRRRKLAELLQQDALKPIEQSSAGGYVTPISWTQGLAKLLQGGVGAYRQKQLTQEQRDLYKRQQDTYTGAGQRLMDAVTPRPAQEATPYDATEFGGDQGMNPAKPAYNPSQQDLMAAQMKYTSDIGRPDLGAQFAMTHANQAMLANALLNGGATDAAPSGAAPSALAPTGTPPAGTPPQGSMLDTVPRADALRLMLIDPTGKLLAEEASKRNQQRNTPINVRPGGTVYIPGQGPQFTAANNGIQTNYGPGGPTASVVPGYGAATTELHSAPNPSAAPIKVPLSGGQEAQLSQPEYLQFQQTGQLPARYGQAGAPPAPSAPPVGAPAGGMQIPPQVQASRDADRMRILQSELATNPNDPALRAEIARETAKQQRGGLGVPGLTQSQPEQVQQAEEMARAAKKGQGQGEQAADKPTATLAFNDAASNLDRLAGLADSLMNHPGIGRITGVRGMLPNVPGMAGADAQAKLDTLKSQAAFTVLQAMRNASKTGGALGQVSDKEELMLSNNLAALQNSQSEGALKDNLQRIIDWAKGAKARMQNAYNMTYNNAEAMPPAGGPAAAPGAVRKWNPATQRLE